MKHGLASLFLVTTILLCTGNTQAKDVPANSSEPSPIVIMYDDLYGNPDGHILLDTMENQEMNLFLNQIDKKVRFNSREIPDGGNLIIVNQKTDNQWKKYVFNDTLLTLIQYGEKQAQFCKITTTE